MDVNLSGYNSAGITEGVGGMDPFGFLGSLISAGVNLFEGSQNRQAKSDQWLKEYAASLNALQNRAADATLAEQKYGINRLTMLGAPTVNVPSMSVGDQMTGAGQDIGRAVAALADKDTKADAAEAEIQKLRVAGLKEDITFKQLQNSRLARTLAAPGSPPSFPYNWRLGGPADPRAMKGRQSMFTEYYDPYDRSTITMLSEGASQASQAAAAIPQAPIIGARMIARNMFPATVEDSLRGDVGRGLTSYNQFYTPF